METKFQIYLKGGYLMKQMNTQGMMKANGGKTYTCPFCKKKFKFGCISGLWKMFEYPAHLKMCQKLNGRR